VADAPIRSGRVAGPAEHYSFVRRNQRWIVAGLLCVVTIINYIDRQTLSVIAPVLQKPVADGGLGMTAQQYGTIGFTFLIFYVAGQALGGIVMDKLGTRIGFAVILTWWSLATIFHRFAGSVFGFAFWRGMLGLGEAGNWPGAIKTISEWFPKSERGFATAVFNLGSSTGAIVAPPLVVGIMHLYGWRNVFVLAGSIGFLWLIAWLWFYRLPREHKFITPEELHHIESGQETVASGSERTKKLPWLTLLRYRQVWGMVIPRFLTEPVWWFYLLWLPTYLAKERGLTLTLGQIGLMAAVPYLTADLGCLLGGGMSSYLVKRGWTVDRARKTVMVFSAFLMPAALFVMKAPTAWTAVALISVATFAHQSWSTNMLTLPADIFPQRVVGSVTGIQGLSIAASAIAQLSIGYVVANYSYAPVFTAAGLLHPTAAIVLLLILGRIERVEMKEAA
jgi:MFS transporter, ACS family, hexuronate transporter